MAQQKGIINFKGRAGNFAFYQGRDGFEARESTGVSGDRVKNDPAFERTRENGAEFGRAGKAGKLFREAFNSISGSIADSRVTSRLTKEMVRVVKSDPSNDRGMRTVESGDLTMLRGFEFNINARLAQTMLLQYQVTIDRVTGVGQVSLPAFTPQRDIAIPDGATDYALVLGIAAIDFAGGTYVRSLQNVNAQRVLNTEIPAAVHAVNIPPNNGDPMFLVFGIEFLQVVNGKNYPLKNGAYSALSLVGVDAVAQ